MLEVENIQVAYHGRPVLENLSLAVRPGEVLAVIGPNGAGKTTLLRSISGVLPLQAGNIRFNGIDLADLSPAKRARTMAVVPQARALPGAFTVEQTVLMGRTPYLNWLGIAGKTDYRVAQTAMEHTQIAHLAQRQVGELSGGEQQRILLARALAQEARLFLLDEPTTHLDLQHQSNLLNLTRSLARDYQKAVLVVLHDLNLASLYADTVALLVDGKIEALGTPEKVLTADRLSHIYHVPVHVIPHPDYGSPLILPDGLENHGAQNHV